MGNKSTKSLITDEINSLILSANQSYNQDIDQPIEILPEIEKLVDAVKILTNETPYDDHFYCDLFLILINIYIKQKKYHHACFCCLKAEQIARKINSGKHIAFCLNRQDETARLSGGLNQKCQLNGKNCQSIHLTSFLFEDTSNDLLSSNQKTILSDCLVGNKEFLKACIRALGNAKFYNNLNRISVMSARYTSICTQSLIELLNISAYRIEKQLTGAAHTGISFTDDVACKLNDDQVFLFTFVTYTLLKNILVTKFAKNTCCGEESNGNTFSKSRTNVTKEEEYGQVNRNYQSTETITTPKINDSFSNYITPFEKLIRLYRQNSQLNESLQSYFTWNDNTANKPSQAIKFCSNNISMAHPIAYYSFIPKSNLYIIPLNMTDAINETLQNWHYSSERISYLETFKEWLVTIIGKDISQNRLSITMNEQTQEYSLPIIILVGLHQGKIHEEQTCQFEQLTQGLLKSLPFLKSHLVSSKIIFNSNLQDNHLDIIDNRRQCRNELMAMIRQFLQSLPLSQENIPAKWLFMGQILHEAVQKHHNQELSINLFDNIMGYSIHKIMKVDDIRQLSRDIGLYEDENFFLDMLSYLNDAGDILYCQNEGIIVTDLQWLVNIAGHASKWYPQRYKDMEFHDELGQINYLKKINCEWLNSLASHFNLDDMERKMIIDVLKIYGIISEISDSDKQCQDNRGYFIPYVLPQYVEEEPNTIKSYEKSDWLHVGYNVQDQKPYIPDNLFRDLISSCLKEWGSPLVQFFHRYAKYFFLNNQYCIVVKKEKSTVAMQYQYEILDNSTSKNTLVHNVKNFIDKFSPHSVLLEELISITNKKMPKFENIRGQFYLKCDLCQRLNGITDVHQRLGYQQIKCQECYSPMSFKALDDWNLGNKVNVKDNIWELSPTHSDIDQIIDVVSIDDNWNKFVPAALWNSFTKQIYDLNQSISIETSIEEERKLYLKYFLKCLNKKSFTLFCDSLLMNSLKEIRKTGHQLVQLATIAITHRIRATMKCYRKSVNCKAMEDNCITLSNLPGFEFHIPADSLKEDTIITVKYYFSDTFCYHNHESKTGQLLLQVVQLEPNDLLINVRNDKSPKLKLPILQPQQVYDSNGTKECPEVTLLDQNIERSGYRFDSKDYKRIETKHEQPCIVFSIEQLSTFYVKSDNINVLIDQFIFDQSLAKLIKIDLPIPSLSLQYPIQFQAQLIQLASSFLFLKISITKKGVQSRPEQNSRLKLYQLINDANEEIFLRGGYYKVKFISSHLVQDSIDSNTNCMKDLFLNWHTSFATSIMFKCKFTVSEIPPPELCQIILLESDEKNNVKEAMSCYLFLPDDAEELL